MAAAPSEHLVADTYHFPNAYVGTHDVDPSKTSRNARQRAFFAKVNADVRPWYTATRGEENDEMPSSTQSTLSNADADADDSSFTMVQRPTVRTRKEPDVFLFEHADLGGNLLQNAFLEMQSTLTTRMGIINVKDSGADWLHMDGITVRPGVLTRLVTEIVARAASNPPEDVDWNGRPYVYAQDKVVPKSTKVLCVGDIHGGIHTVHILMQRWYQHDIVDKKTGRIADGYFIVFLGDLVDRGQCGVLVMLFLHLLKALNPDRCVIVRGNHEANTMMWNYGLLNQMKMRSNAGEDAWFASMRTSLTQLCWSTPCCLRLQFEGTSDAAFLCHGGPVDLAHAPSVIADDAVFPLSPEEADDLMWTDLTNLVGTLLPQWGARGPTGKRHSGTSVKATLERLKCTTLVRGHQDSFMPAWLYSRPHSLLYVRRNLPWARQHLLNPYVVSDRYLDDRASSGFFFDDLTPVSAEMHFGIQLSHLIHYTVSKPPAAPPAALLFPVLDNLIYRHAGTHVAKTGFASRVDLTRVRTDPDAHVYPVITTTSNFASGRAMNGCAFVMLHLLPEPLVDQQDESFLNYEPIFRSMKARVLSLLRARPDHIGMFDAFYHADKLQAVAAQPPSSSSASSSSSSSSSSLKRRASQLQPQQHAQRAPFTVASFAPSSWNKVTILTAAPNALRSDPDHDTHQQEYKHMVVQVRSIADGVELECFARPLQRAPVDKTLQQVQFVADMPSKKERSRMYMKVSFGMDDALAQFPPTTPDMIRWAVMFKDASNHTEKRDEWSGPLIPALETPPRSGVMMIRVEKEEDGKTVRIATWHPETNLLKHTELTHSNADDVISMMMAIEVNTVWDSTGEHMVPYSVRWTSPNQMDIEAMEKHLN